MNFDTPLVGAGTLQGLFLVGIVRRELCVILESVESI